MGLGPKGMIWGSRGGIGWELLSINEHLILYPSKVGSGRDPAAWGIPVPGFIPPPIRNAMAAPGQAAFAGASMEPGSRGAPMPIFHPEAKNIW